jgi:hypothetical protein
MAQRWNAKGEDLIKFSRISSWSQTRPDFSEFVQGIKCSSLALHHVLKVEQTKSPNLNVRWRIIFLRREIRRQRSCPSDVTDDEFLDSDESSTSLSPKFKAKGSMGGRQFCTTYQSICRANKMPQVAYMRRNATKHTTGAPWGTVSNVHSYFGPSNRKKQAQL